MPMTPWKKHALAAAAVLLPIALFSQSTPAPTPAETDVDRGVRAEVDARGPAASRQRAKYPFIDVHNHQDATDAGRKVDKLVADMDELNMAVMVNLSGGYGDELRKGVANMKGRYPKRFVLFANVDFTSIDEPDFGQNAAAPARAGRQAGAQGLKIFKNLGMYRRRTRTASASTPTIRASTRSGTSAPSSASRC